MVKSNPFTPQTGWEPKSFQGRKTQIDHFRSNIKYTLATHRPNHMVLLGDWGIGKTSLLKLYKNIAQAEGLLSTFCSIPNFSEKDTTKDAVNLIIEEILKGFPVIKGLKKFIEDIEGIGISIAGFGGQVSRKKKTPSPQIVLTDFLVRLWASLNTELAVVLIDDVQNFSSIHHVIDILRLVLSRDEIILQTNYLFILSSTYQGWNLFLDKHDPIGRFFRKCEKIKPLTRQETLSVISETLKNTGVHFSKDITNFVYKYTMGHPYELQVICSNLYESQINGMVSKRQWKMVFQKTISTLSEEFFDSLFRKASSREETILKIFCQTNKPMVFKDIQVRISIIDKSFPTKDVRLYIYRLVDKGLLKQVDKKNYSLIDNLFREYLLLHL